jgi:hypothetical protein
MTSATARGSRLGNLLITVAGADKTELDARSTDRSYYVGMGSGLLMTATISTLSMSEATSIAFGMRFGSAPIVVAGIIYFLLILGLDRWLVSDQTTGFPGAPPGAVSAVGAWLRHFIIELFKISPRVFIAFISSLLFARFLLLAIYDHEIQQQLTKIEQQRIAQYDVQVQGVAQEITDQAQAILNQAKTADSQIQTQYNQGQQAKEAAYKQEQAGLTAANKAGLSCSEEPYYTVATNPNTGFDYNVLGGYSQVCPPQIQSIYNTYNTVAAEYPMTEADVIAAQNASDSKYGVATQKGIIKNAPTVAKQEMGPYKPRQEDGLLAREGALQMLTTPPGGTCPPNPTETDLADNTACTSLYSAGAATEMVILRYFLLGFEMLPVVMKFVNSLLPRRAYAWTMAAREAERRETSKGAIKQIKNKVETDVAAFMRREHARLEEEGALQEYQVRELARQQRGLGLRRVRSRFAAALAGSERGRKLKTRLGWRRHGSAEEGDALLPRNVVPMSAYVNPRGTHADPGYGVIDSEDFLY